MTVVKRIVLIGLVLASGCGRQQDQGATPAMVAEPAQTDAERNADFWSDVAASHFTPNRSHRGEPLPAGRLMDKFGHATALPALRGKPLLINFWANWCVPCRAEMPTLNTYARQPGSHYRVVAVNEDKVRPFSTSLGTLPVDPAITQLTDDDGTVARTLAGQGLPTTVLYGSDGRERWRLVGVLDWTKPQAQSLLRETH